MLMTSPLILTTTIAQESTTSPLPQFPQGIFPILQTFLTLSGTSFIIKSRKKINGFIFVQYNLYKLEINFIDLGYSSLVQINYWTHDVGHQSVEEKIGFSLPEDFNEATLNLDIQKRNFDFHVRQNVRLGKNGHTETVTTFNITLTQNQIEFFANYTHVKRD
jgi:hypothetical protein